MIIYFHSQKNKTMKRKFLYHYSDQEYKNERKNSNSTPINIALLG